MQLKLTFMTSDQQHAALSLWTKTIHDFKIYISVFCVLCIIFHMSVLTIKIVICTAWLSAVPNFAQLESALSATFLSLTQGCPWLFSAWLKAVPDFSQLDSALSQTVLSLTKRCPRQCSVDSALSPAWFSFMQRYPGQRSVYTQHCTWLNAVQVIAQPGSALSWKLLSFFQSLIFALLVKKKIKIGRHNLCF